MTIGSDIYIAGDNAFVMRSQDNGQTWTNIYTNATGSEYFMALAYDAQNLIAAGFNHNVWARPLAGVPDPDPTPTPTPTPSPTPPPATSSDLTILVGRYGADGVFADVRQLLQQAVTNNVLTIEVGNHTMGGDPIFGVVKDLLVQYSTSAGSFEVTVEEGGTLSIPATILDQFLGCSLYSDEEPPQFLGVISRSTFGDSIRSRFGSYGSAYSSTSIRNRYSTYGSP